MAESEGKRPPVDDEESDDDYGPAPVSGGAKGEGGGAEEVGPPQKKKRRRLEHEEVYVNALPCADMYEKSYMHRDWVTHCVFTPKSDFLVTASQDGHVKFWKKMPEGLEFVKHYHAHLGKSVLCPLCIIHRHSLPRHQLNNSPCYPLERHLYVGLVHSSSPYCDCS